MNVAYINPFIQGTQLVLNTLCGDSLTLGKLFVKDAPYKPLQVSVSISIIGDIKGEVVYNMQVSDGCFIASKMMMGMPVAELDDMSKSAISELANMISGNVATIFAGKGLMVDITTPHFFMDANAGDFPGAAAVDKVVCVPLHFQDGHSIELDIMIP